MKDEMGAYNYHSTKNFEIFETGPNDTEISWEKFQKIRKLLSFRKVNHSTENSGNPRIKVKWDEISRKNFSKIWVCLTRLCFSLEFMQIPNFLPSAG